MASNSNEYGRAYYLANKDKFVVAMRAKRAWMDSLKAGRPCADCQGLYPSVCLHWHHRDPLTKTMTISRDRRSKAAILAEIEKCDLLCANCHAIRTWRPELVVVAA